MNVLGSRKATGLTSSSTFPVAWPLAAITITIAMTIVIVIVIAMTIAIARIIVIAIAIAIAMTIARVLRGWLVLVERHR